MTERAFISRYSRISNQLINKVHVRPHVKDNNHTELGRELDAQWDTGATATVISKRLAKELGLKVVSVALSSGVNGTFETNVYYIDLFLPNKVVIPKLRVTEGEFDDIDVLIGMDIMMQGDFAVSNYAGRTSFSFRLPSIGEIDFVENSYRLPYKKQNEPSRNAPCPCGSGKKYKNCCGKK